MAPTEFPVSYKPIQIARIRSGKCIDCGTADSDGTLRCRACKDRWAATGRENRKRRYRLRVASRLCVRCGDPADEGSVYCPSCREDAKAVNKANQGEKARRLRVQKRKCRDAQTCIVCGAQTLPGTFMCAVHYGKKQEYRHNLRDRKNSSAVCSCGEPKVGKAKNCMLCWCRRRLVGSGMDPALAPVLAAKWESQQGRCYYTREKLTQGINASIEHIRALKSHPTLANDPDNLVWATLVVNRAKRDTSPADFVAMCEAVVANKAAILDGIPPLSAPSPDATMSPTASQGAQT